ncbi:hypothetical protein HGB07_02545 [Candidatus Roizmanbacteria bacterium]|nr:hypothetical protein [Candidatus Roizmanbacteria bacterium]
MLSKEILHVLRYFALFEYPASQAEIYSFLQVKTTKTELDITLRDLITRNRIKKIVWGKIARYTIVGESIHSEVWSDRTINSQKKKNIAMSVARLIGILPWVSLVGLSGSVAMLNAREEDDLDLFVVSSPERIWLVRLWCVAVVTLLGRRRWKGSTRVKDTVCLNLFFDEQDLEVPVYKRGEYVAHEILQLKPLVNKHKTYEIFLQRNSWVYEYFPNNKINQNISKHIHKTSFLDIWLSRLEIGSSWLQMKVMGKRTTEIVTSTQLWFFPDDFEKKVKKWMKK